MKKFQIILVFSFLTFFCYSQNQVSNAKPSKINIWLKQKIKMGGTETIHFMVQGDVAKIKAEIKNFGGHFKYDFQDFAAVSIPANQVEAFSKKEYVNRIEYCSAPAQFLNDEEIKNNRVDSVHGGYGPLPQGYDGEGVVIGVVDAGLELEHPDFKDTGNVSRVLYYWNQSNPIGTHPAPYNYGSEWNHAQIVAGQVGQTTTSSHGSHVTGIAAGNGRSVNKLWGMAPKADIIFVESEGDPVKVADAIRYIFAKADELNKPCVINLSIGSYIGSHDGEDAVTKSIEQMLLEKNGRSVVCASGNSGDRNPYHLSYQVTADTSFTWFKYNPATWYGFNGVIFELWADTQDFKHVQFAIGADEKLPLFNFKYRGRTNFSTVALGDHSQTLYSTSGNRLGVAGTYAEIQGDKYFIQVYLLDIDSTQYYFRFMTTGSGKFDVWSSPNETGSSQIASTFTDTFPGSSVFPDIIHYKYPDLEQTIVSDWACSPEVITVGNYVNRDHFTDYNGIVRYPSDFGNSSTIINGTLFQASSKGPTRTGLTKPDLTAPGTWVFSCVRLGLLAYDIVHNPQYIAPGGYHKINSGTSMSSPAVAGIVALYLQACKNASNQDIKWALLNNTNIESSMGAMPNNAWGYGKVNAFKAITKGNSFSVLNTTDTTICDRITASILPGYDHVLWSDGDTTAHNKILQDSGVYYVSADSASCLHISNPFYVTIENNPIPKPDLHLIGSNNFCDGDSVILYINENVASYLWNDLSTNNTLIVKTTDYYSLEVTDSNNCHVKTDSILIIRKVTPPQPTVTNYVTYLKSSIAHAYQWYKNGVMITDSTNQMLYPATSGYYQVEVFHIDGCSVFSDSILFTAVGVDEYSNKSSIEIYPNPAQNKLHVLSSKRIEKMWISDIQGKIIELPFHFNAEGKYEINVGEISNGIYYLAVQTPGAVQNHLIIVQK